VIGGGSDSRLDEGFHIRRTVEWCQKCGTLRTRRGEYWMGGYYDTQYRRLKKKKVKRKPKKKIPSNARVLELEMQA